MLSNIHFLARYVIHFLYFNISILMYSVYSLWSSYIIFHVYISTLVHHALHSSDKLLNYLNEFCLSSFYLSFSKYNSLSNCTAGLLYKIYELYVILLPKYNLNGFYLKPSITERDSFSNFHGVNGTIFWYPKCTKLFNQTTVLSSGLKENLFRYKRITKKTRGVHCVRLYSYHLS